MKKIYQIPLALEELETITKALQLARDALRGPTITPEAREVFRAMDRLEKKLEILKEV